MSTVYADKPKPASEAAAGRPQGTILKGQYVKAFRSDKGKIRGLILRTIAQELVVELPKYLRPMLVRELLPDTWVQVWAYHEAGNWRAINIMPLPDTEAMYLRRARSDTGRSPELSHTESPQTATIQVCTRGKCCKQGSQHTFRALQLEVSSNPELQHVSIEAVGCMKACKLGPNVRLLPSGKMINWATPAQALSALSEDSHVRQF